MDARDELVARLGREGVWEPVLGALLAEIAEALKMAERLREAALEELFTKSARSGRSYAHSAIALCDAEVKRASPLIQRLFAMVKLEPAVEEPDEELSPLDEQTMFDPDPVVDAPIHKERRERRRELS
jgi:hypothetical protein